MFLFNCRLACCNISGESCRQLAKALQSEHSDLEELDLSNNDLTDSGVEALAAVLAQSKLQTLRCSANTSLIHLMKSLGRENKSQRHNVVVAQRSFYV